MKEKELISKWLDHDLTEKELEAFKQLDAFGSLDRISQTAKYFKAPEMDTAQKYDSLSEIVASKKKKKTKSLWKPTAAAAAIAALFISFYVTFFAPHEATYLAENAERVEFLLPDSSEVKLNAGSAISYDQDTWKDDRSLTLEGEAYFKVAKGSRFTVKTNQGEVVVLGTEFNVKDRTDYFEVICFEGLVSVIFKNETKELPAGTSFTVYKGNQTNQSVSMLEPAWLNQKSHFKSVAIGEVIKEIERQFDVRVDVNAIDLSTLYTGTISHSNLQEALQAVAIPLGLEVVITKNTVTLKK